LLPNGKANPFAGSDGNSCACAIYVIAKNVIVKSLLILLFFLFPVLTA